MSIDEAVARYRDVIGNLATGNLRRIVIQSEKLAQIIASSKGTVRFHHKTRSGKTVIYKCIKKALLSSVASLSSEFSSETDVQQFLHLNYIYQSHFQALSGQINKYCGMKKYYELKFAAIDYLETEAQTTGLTLSRFWVASLDEFIKKERWPDNGSNFQIFYKLMAEYSSWKWDSDDKRQLQFMYEFRTKLKECLVKFYENFDLQKSSDPLKELIIPWEKIVYVANCIDAFTGEQVRIDGAELIWTSKNLVFSSISSAVLRLNDLQNMFSAFRPYGKEALVQDFAHIRSLKWDSNDKVESLIRALIFNDMFPYFNKEQVDTKADGIFFLRLLRKNFKEHINDVKDFHIQVIKYLNSQFKNNYSTLMTSSKTQDRRKSHNMPSSILDDGNKIGMRVSPIDEYSHFVDNDEPLWRDKVYPKIYTNEQTPTPDASAIFDSHKIYAIISLLRYYLPEKRKFFRIYYLPSIFKRILYYGAKFAQLYFMEGCLERLVIESLQILEPSLVHAINNLIKSSIESLKNVTVTSDDKTSSGVIILSYKEFKSLSEVNKDFNEPFWPNQSIANSWPDFANKQLKRGQILQDAFAFHLFEIELPIIIDTTRNTHLKLVSNMCTTSILYLYNEVDSLSLTSIQEKLAVLPTSKRNEILLYNLNRLTKLKLLLLKENEKGQKFYAFNFNYKRDGQKTSLIRLI
ncbi:BAF_collapsed_G0004530.mRNA.1.CDS.1 [Saccharomyces cerevisiae]|nr:BAF_collapsed_G0004530.mRNA.1.CDS.1 [Saccharomyces cerevisiae]